MSGSMSNGFVICLIFSIVVWRQIQLMARTLEDSFNPVIYLIGSGIVAIAAMGLVAALLVL